MCAAVAARSAQRAEPQEELHEHKVPLLACDERSADEAGLTSHLLEQGAAAPSRQPQQHQAVVTALAAPPPPPVDQQQSLDIRASVAPYDVATGRPVAVGLPPGAGGGPPALLLLQELPPSAGEMWHAQRGLMVSWMVASVLSLVLFAPLYILSGLFIAAEVAAVLGICASSAFLCRRRAANGADLAFQIKAAAACGACASFLDWLTASLAMMVALAGDCGGDSLCDAAVAYAAYFAGYMLLHGALSAVVGRRAREIQPLLNPVSSGLVQL